MDISASSSVATTCTEVVFHPLVLLSVADHYHRVAKDSRKRVVGVMLGSRTKSRVDVTNSFAVPFEEDLSNPNVWFLDHNFLDSMFWMFKKVNSHEEMVGFYSSGPKIKENDLKISALFRQFCTHEPIFAIVDVRPGVKTIPTTAYEAVEEVESEGKEIQHVFKHINSSIEADEAEAVGVEHLLRDINDPTTSTLALEIKQKLSGLVGLLDRLQEMKAYLENVKAGRLPANSQIINNFQDMFNLIPNLNVKELLRSMRVGTNDMHLVLYISSLVRSVISLHDLLSNKMKYKDVDSVLDRSAGVEAGPAASATADTTKPAESDASATGGAASPKK